MKSSNVLGRLALRSLKQKAVARATKPWLEAAWRSLSGFLTKRVVFKNRPKSCQIFLGNTNVMKSFQKQPNLVTLAVGIGLHFICFGSDYSTFGRRLLYSFAAAFIISHCFLFRRNSEKCFRKSDPDMKTIINTDTDADVVKLCTKSSNDIKYNDDEKYLYDKSPTLDSLLMLGCPLTS